MDSHSSRGSEVYPLADIPTPPALHSALQTFFPPDDDTTDQLSPVSRSLYELNRHEHAQRSQLDDADLARTDTPDRGSQMHMDGPLDTNNVDVDITTENTEAERDSHVSTMPILNLNDSTTPPPSGSPNSALPSPVSDIGHAFGEDYLSMLDEAQVSVEDIVNGFDTLPLASRDYFLLQLLKRSPMDALRQVNSYVTEALKCDIVTRIPPHIAHVVFSNLDVYSLCHATQVSRHWHDLIDGDSWLWKQKLLQADFSLTDTEKTLLNSSATTMDIDSPSDDMNCHPFKHMFRRHHIIRRNWQLNRAKHIQVDSHSSNVITCLQFDEDKIITGSDDHSINIYDIRTGELRQALHGHEGGVWALQYVGNTLVTGSTDRTIRVWDIEKGTCKHVFRGHSSTVRCLVIVMPVATTGDPGDESLTPSEPLIVSGSRDHTLRVWQLPDLEKDDSHQKSYHVHTLSGHTQSVRTLAAYGDVLASGSYDHTVRIWNLNTGKACHVLEGHELKVYSVVLDMKRRRCISGSMDATIRIWNIDDGACLHVLRGHTFLVGILGIADDYLVSAASDASLRVWTAEGDCLYVLVGHLNAITAFQHDGHKAISGSEGGLKMWDIRTGHLMHDLLKDLNGVWKVAFDYRRCVAAIKGNDTLTRLCILDYGAHGGVDDDTMS